jgi:hypothetical protein
MRRIRSRYATGFLALGLAAVLLGGCAGQRASSMPLPPARTLQPSDLASLAGVWEGALEGTPGTGTLGGRSASATVTVAPDGSYTSNINGLPGSGKAGIQGGRVVFEGSSTRGTATLHEGGGRRVLKGQGTWVGISGDTAFELTKR